MIWTEADKNVMRDACAGLISPQDFANRLEESGAIKRFLYEWLEQGFLEEELEYRGRWADDGGSLVYEDVELARA